MDLEDAIARRERGRERDKRGPHPGIPVLRGIARLSASEELTPLRCSARGDAHLEDEIGACADGADPSGHEKIARPDRQIDGLELRGRETIQPSTPSSRRMAL